MTIVGFNFNKIDVTRKDVMTGKIDINNNVMIKDIEEANFNLANTKEGGLKFTFEFTSKYGKEEAHITLGGNVLFLVKSDDAKKIAAEWKKDKKIKKEVLGSILNTVLTKCNIQALLLSKEMNLPPPIPLPKINVESHAAAKKPAAKKTAKK